MSEKLEAKSINGRLVDINYLPMRVILNENLGKELPEFFIDKAKKIYAALRILPLELALEGSIPKIGVFPAHIVYAKCNPVFDLNNYHSPVLIEAGT